MDLNSAFNIAMALVSFLGGWVMKVLFERIARIEDANRQLAATVNEIRVQLPTYYVSKGDFRDVTEAISSSLRRIEEKLDRKVDKD